MRFVFNGYLFTQRQTGVMRYARETLIELDKICQKQEFALVVPEYATSIPTLNNIEIIKYGKIKGNLWEQIDFAKFLRRNKLISVNFNNTMPITNPGVIFIHDIAYKLHPEFGSSLHGKISNLYHKIIFRRAKNSNVPIVTVSYFSKYQIVDFYKITPSRIHVIGSAWQHINSKGYDDSVFNLYPIEKKDYYLSIGSLSKMKNTRWFIEVARKQTDKIFVLCGAQSFSSGEDFQMPENVICTGFISDEQIKSLIRECKAFIYPSIYDGFGLPPMEALSQGVDVICSNAACLPEIYKNSVHYIDPYDTDVDLEEILLENIDESSYVLDSYSWEKTAKKLYNLLLTQPQ